MKAVCPHLKVGITLSLHDFQALPGGEKEMEKRWADEFTHYLPALEGVEDCIAEGIPVKGYLHWTLLDNFEWQKAYSVKFGLIAVDRATQKRTVKPSLAYLGSQR